jgi:serine/threonine protein kinase
MADDLPPPDPGSAELQGLPQRSQSRGRDKLEELASQYLDRRRAGDSIDIETFVAEHPSLTLELRDFLPLVAAMEDWKSHRELKSIQQPLPEKFEIKQLGEYRIVGEIARGGMGVVFEAEQKSLNRRVAVKLLPWKFPKESVWAEQFVREARIAAGLQHANIVPVYSFGEEGDRYYYVMQLIEGVGLDKLIERWRRSAEPIAIEELVREHRPLLAARLPPQNKANRVLPRNSWLQLGKIAAQVSSAIRYAHKQGMLHRDLKPANLLIDLQGKVWIADFGLAIGREQMLTDPGDTLAGTLRFMAPEQFRGEGDERSDLYAFGATLYELCTLRAAFPAKTRNELIRDIKKGVVALPRSINPEIPDRLQKIIMKAISHKPENRYQTADLMHADLLQFINSPIETPGLWNKIRKWF